ncbi:hypothetical protein RJ639_024401 [Escallonia herrerae]|uniref:tRNA/rRNA methyltransferase SpoU type domain-containing protein n=1 Tax=Escallonia herrerae TaxID=1293975 RepID=A0AA89AC62_9ASTE|nr:hypothetical protein RJ639_024401 [Escallonia herrerae]
MLRSTPIQRDDFLRPFILYLRYVVVKVHGSWAEFRDYFRQQVGEKRLLAFTKRGTQIHSGNWVFNDLGVDLGSATLQFHAFGVLAMVGAALWALVDSVEETFLCDYSYRRGDWLVFGSETSGLPPEALLDCKNEPFGGGTVRIPMVETYVRCLNLSVSVGIALYEASRQLDYEQLQSPSEPDVSSQKSFIVEDVFA